MAENAKNFLAPHFIQSLIKGVQYAPGGPERLSDRNFAGVPKVSGLTIEVSHKLNEDAVRGVALSIVGHLSNQAEIHRSGTTLFITPKKDSPPTKRSPVEKSQRGRPTAPVCIQSLIKDLLNKGLIPAEMGETALGDLKSPVDFDAHGPAHIKPPTFKGSRQKRSPHGRMATVRGRGRG